MDSQDLHPEESVNNIHDVVEDTKEDDEEEELDQNPTYNLSLQEIVDRWNADEPSDSSTHGIRTAMQKQTIHSQSESSSSSSSSSSNTNSEDSSSTITHSTDSSSSSSSSDRSRKPPARRRLKKEQSPIGAIHPEEDGWHDDPDDWVVALQAEAMKPKRKRKKKASEDAPRMNLAARRMMNEYQASHEIVEASIQRSQVQNPEIEMAHAYDAIPRMPGENDASGVPADPNVDEVGSHLSDPFYKLCVPGADWLEIDQESEATDDPKFCPYCDLSQNLTERELQPRWGKIHSYVQTHFREISIAQMAKDIQEMWNRAIRNCTIERKVWTKRSIVKHFFVDCPSTDVMIELQYRHLYTMLNTLATKQCYSGATVDAQAATLYIRLMKDSMPVFHELKRIRGEK